MRFRFFLYDFAEHISAPLCPCGLIELFSFATVRSKQARGLGSATPRIQNTKNVLTSNRICDIIFLEEIVLRFTAYGIWDIVDVDV